MHRPTVASAARFCLAAGICSLAMLIGWATPANSRADDAKPDNTAQQDDTANFVTKLGDDLFAVRENASNQLVQEGIAAKPQLLAALESSDAEVRFRAKHILAEVVEADFQRRLSAFSADVDSKLDLSMPGWSAYKQAVGSDRTARDLFVEMQQAEGPLLETYELGPKQASEKLRAQLAAEPAVVDRAAAIAALKARRQILQLSSLQPSGTSSLGSLLAWLFVAGDDAVPMSDDVTARVVMLPQNNVFQQAALTNSKDADARAAVCRKILARWVARDISPNFAVYNLKLAYVFNLKEGLGPAIGILKQAQASIDAKCQALLLVGKFGNKQHISLLEPFLKDAVVCLDSGGVNQPVQTQIRDIALVMTVKLAGQDPKQFGFDRWQNNDQLPLNLHTIGFRSQEDRDAALKKWEDWQAGQKSAAGAEAGTKATGENSG